MTEATCKERVEAAWASREEDIRRLWIDGEEECEGERYEYGLSFDYVAAHTFEDQPEGYWRFQISWGGPSDEIRFYRDGTMRYWFLDWFDGASIDVTDEEAACTLRDDFEDMDMMDPDAADDEDREAEEYAA